MITRLREYWWNYYFVILMGLATLFSGWINYLYHPLMVRYLSPSDFWLFESLMSLFNLVTILFAGFALYLTQQVSIHHENPQYIGTLYHIWTRRMGRWSSILIVLLIIISPLIQWYIHLPTVYPIIIVALSLIAGGIGIVYGAILQWKNQFEYIAISSILWAILRVSIGVGAVTAGYGLYGAVAGVTIAWFLIFLLQRYRVKNISLLWKNHLSKEIYLTFMKERPKIIMFCLVMVVSIGLANADILIVQNLFGKSAVSYIAISVVAKFLIFLGSAIETVYYPQLTKHVLNKDSRVQLRNYLVMTILLIGGAYVGAYLLWWIILDLFKPGLWVELPLFLKLVLVSGCIFLFVSLLKLFVARKKYRIVFSLVLSSYIVIMALQFWRGNTATIYTINEFIVLYQWYMIGLGWLSLWLLLYCIRISYESERSI